MTDRQPDYLIPAYVASPTITNTIKLRITVQQYSLVHIINTVRNIGTMLSSTMPSDHKMQEPLLINIVIKLLLINIL